MNVRTWFIVFVLAGVLIDWAAAAPAARAQGTFAHGTVVALRGTPHLWVADRQGVLHWAGDTRALADKYVRWGRESRVEVTLEQLRRLTRGDPWLSAGLLKDGDPIYLVKWETRLGGAAAASHSIHRRRGAIWDKWQQLRALCAG